MRLVMRARGWRTCTRRRWWRGYLRGNALTPGRWCGQCCVGLGMCTQACPQVLWRRDEFCALCALCALCVCLRVCARGRNAFARSSLTRRPPIHPRRHAGKDPHAAATALAFVRWLRSVQAVGDARIGLPPQPHVCRPSRLVAPSVMCARSPWPVVPVFRVRAPCMSCVVSASRLYVRTHTRAIDDADAPRCGPVGAMLMQRRRTACIALLTTARRATRPDTL